TKKCTSRRSTTQAVQQGRIRRSGKLERPAVRQRTLLSHGQANGRCVMTPTNALYRKQAHHVRFWPIADIRRNDVRVYLPSRADICSVRTNVRFGPKADY